jgi:methylated-DNA-[protein]-cysteine S-methyltransferase
MDQVLVRSMLETPVGALQLTVDDEGILLEILLPNHRPSTSSSKLLSPAAAAGLRAARAQLNEYFLCKRRVFDLPLQAAGTPFEQQVWTKLLAVPYGVTTSYGAIADELGLINGARAVGRANGANPIPIIIPCHRVIGSDGSLTGYGGGLPLKRALLELEGAIGPAEPRLF